MIPQSHIFAMETETARVNANSCANRTNVPAIRESVSLLPIIVVSGALAVSSTSSADPARLWEAARLYESDATTSGLGREHSSETASDVEVTRRAISELRRISGLTWEQLGRLFDVSRRSVHFWASGKPLNADNEQRLMQVLDVVRAAYRGDARSTRAALSEAKDGTTAFALLAAQQFEDARTILGVGTARPRPAPTGLGAADEAARKPLPPGELVDALQDRVHRDRGQGRAARTVRDRRRGTA